MKLFDTHAHYDDEKYYLSDSTPELLLKQLFEDNVELIMGAATDVESSKRQIAFAQEFENFYASIGVHPGNCPSVCEIPKTLEIFEELVKNEKVKAVGEIGLDYYWEENPPKEVQKAWFEAQLEFAQRHNLPVIVHDREAHGDSFDIISKYPDVKGVFHCYAGSAEMAKQLTNKGWYISFTGVITFPKTQKYIEVLKTIPDNKLLLETDCPYMAPVPNRGKINNSSYAIYTAEKMAEIKGKTTEEIVKITLENGKRLFNID